ncbi:MAG: serine/threonine-protein kinase [Myxococcota bacterium]
MAQMLARLPRGGGPAGGSAGMCAEEPTAVSVGTAADEEAMQASSDTADRHMAQMLARLPQGGGPAGGSPAGALGTAVADDPSAVSQSPTGDKNLSAAPASPAAANRLVDRPSTLDDNAAPHANRPHNRSREPDISSWSPPFQDLFDTTQKPAFEPGQSIDRYIVLEELGAGAMGAVLKAYDAQLDRAIAIKLLLHEGNEDDTARFQREAQALAKLSHSNVIQVHDVGEIDGQTFIAMELVKGQTLREWMEEPEQPRPWRECLNVYVQAGAGLAAAHDAGLIHRDFKPDNAIIDAKGQVRVLDFGMARRTQGTTNAQPELHDDRPADLAAHDLALEASITNPGTIMGTPLYMPPEQWRGEEAGPHSDQFSFCVALYEALYGMRPFAGKTIYELMDTIAEGRIQLLDPKGSAVPSRVRNVVLRGLSPDREQRWPSMDDLLAELRRLAAPPGRRYIARALAVGLAAMAGSAGFLGYLEMKDRCTGAPAQMEGIWDDDRRQAVEAAILGTEVSYAPGTWTRVEERLDDYVNAWTDKHTEVCEATSVRGEQPQEALRLRMQCLSKRRSSLRASVDQLADANAETVENAVKLVTGLPTLTLCDDLERLEQQDQRMPPPEDPDVAAEVETLRERLADIAAMQEAGRYAEALEKVEPVMQRATALDYPPLIAEAQYRRGKLREKNGQYTEAEEDLRQAHALAVEHYHDKLALDTAQPLTFVVGELLARHAEGRQWSQMVALPLAQRSGEPLELAYSLYTLGAVYVSQGDYENAISCHKRALAIRDKMLEDDHPDIAGSLNSLGIILEAKGDLGNAKHYLQRAIVIRKKAFGPDHPSVASGLSNLGHSFFLEGNNDSAKSYYRRALAIWEKALGSAHPDVAMGLSSMGNVFFREGDYKSAKVYHQRALVIREKALGREHPKVAASLLSLGNVFGRDGDYKSASSYHRRALAISEKVLEAGHPNIATCLMNLGIALTREGDYRNAVFYHKRALLMLEKTLGGEHSDVATSLDNLGVALYNQGDLGKARAHHERALAIREKTQSADNPDIAATLTNLGLVFEKQGGYDGAKAHYERALAIRERAQGPDHPDVADVLINLGYWFARRGDYENANLHYQRTLEIWEKALGLNHPYVAESLVRLAEVALKIGDLESAQAHAERAVSIHEMAATAPELLAEAHFVLAQALWSKRHERPQARALAEQAREALAASESPGESEVDLDDVNTWLATHRVK